MRPAVRLAIIIIKKEKKNVNPFPALRTCDVTDRTFRAVERRIEWHSVWVPTTDFEYYWMSICGSSECETTVLIGSCFMFAKTLEWQRISDRRGRHWGPAATEIAIRPFSVGRTRTGSTNIPRRHWGKSGAHCNDDLRSVRTVSIIYCCTVYMNKTLNRAATEVTSATFTIQPSGHRLQAYG